MTVVIMMLACDPIIPLIDRPFKTSIVFAHDCEGTSALFNVLAAFAFCDISLTKIESRPHRHHPICLVDDANIGTAKHFEYMLYIDFQASMAETRNALAEIQELTSFLRVLDSYPMDMTTCPTTSSSTPAATAAAILFFPLFVFLSGSVGSFFFKFPHICIYYYFMVKLHIQRSRLF